MSRNLPKKYLKYPLAKPATSRVRQFIYIAAGLILFPFSWGASYFIGAPGIAFRSRCIFIGLVLLVTKRAYRRAYSLMVCPMDSFRYFEFDYMWKTINNQKISSYLDVSSPRLLPLMIIKHNKNLTAHLLNPDKKDLPLTVSLAESLGIESRCLFHSDLIDDVDLQTNSFDLITSISVIEHILDDKHAVQKMWELLKPGGRLLISVPCALRASEEYINLNDYELNEQDENGFVFWQRYYDEELIKRQIYSITGEPSTRVIYGEKVAGSYHRNVFDKRAEPSYPCWREPLMMGLEYEYKNSFDELSEMGVVAMEFVK